jgi:hypothetical protein
LTGYFVFIGLAGGIQGNNSGIIFAMVLPAAWIAGIVPASITAALDKLFELLGARSVQRYLLTAIAGYARWACGETIVSIEADPESDAVYRRSIMKAWAKLLRERDELLKNLKVELGDVGNIRHERDKINSLIDEIAEKDMFLLQSRYNRAFERATRWDRMVVGVQSFFHRRDSRIRFELTKLAVLGAVTVAGAKLYEYVPALLAWINKQFGSLDFTSSAYGAVTLPDSGTAEGVKILLLIGFAVVVGLVFMWFAGVASLSMNSQTRKSAFEFVKRGMSFFVGVVTGLFAKPF